MEGAAARASGGVRAEGPFARGEGISPGSSTATGLEAARRGQNSCRGRKGILAGGGDPFFTIRNTKDPRQRDGGVGNLGTGLEHWDGTRTLGRDSNTGTGLEHWDGIDSLGLIPRPRRTDFVHHEVAKAPRKIRTPDRCVTY